MDRRGQGLEAVWCGIGGCDVGALIVLCVLVKAMVQGTVLVSLVS